MWVEDLHILRFQSQLLLHLDDLLPAKQLNEEKFRREGNWYNEAVKSRKRSLLYINRKWEEGGLGVQVFVGELSLFAFVRILSSHKLSIRRGDFHIVPWIPCMHQTMWSIGKAEQESTSSIPDLPPTISGWTWASFKRSFRVSICEASWIETSLGLNSLTCSAWRLKFHLFFQHRCLFNAQ